VPDYIGIPIIWNYLKSTYPYGNKGTKASPLHEKSHPDFPDGFSFNEWLTPISFPIIKLFLWQAYWIKCKSWGAIKNTLKRTIRI